MAKQTQHRSMRGKLVDMNILQKKNELTPAIGNASMNARGDQIGAGGKIVRKREEIVKAYYAEQQSVVKDASGRAKTKTTAPTEEQVLEQAATSMQEDLSIDELAMFDEAAAEDDWVEDESGNFVKSTTPVKKGKK